MKTNSALAVPHAPAKPHREPVAAFRNLQVLEKLYEQRGNTNVIEVTEKTRFFTCSGRLSGSAAAVFIKQYQLLIL
jgi:hypothetical protein